MEIKKDLRQRDIDAYFPELRGMSTEEYSSPERAGQIVRAALKAGILTGAAVKDVDDLVPGFVIKWATKVNDAVAEALTVPPD